MSLDGLRAWIGEVERKLGMRTRVFLVLTVLAIGLGGAAIYLALDARDDSVSEGDVQALQDQLEERIDALAAPAATTTPAEPETAPKPVPEAKPEAGKKGASESPTEVPGGAAGEAKLKELLEQTKERAEEAE
jgi:hypothetical protein